MSGVMKIDKCRKCYHLCCDKLRIEVKLFDELQSVHLTKTVQTSVCFLSFLSMWLINRQDKIRANIWLCWDAQFRKIEVALYVNSFPPVARACKLRIRPS